MVIYICRSDGAYAKFEGMTQQAITDMLSEQGLSCTFIDQPTYEANSQRR
jgi:hypothetical protein